MSLANLYHLHFRTPLRVGERGVGLEATLCYLPADTLFSAICSVWRVLFDEQSLQDQLLMPFLNKSTMPFLITSAYPFAGDVRFYPKPLGIRPERIENQEKVFKRVKYVSEIVFNQMVQGTSPSFEQKNCVNGDAVWLSDDERKSLRNFIDDENDGIRFWKTMIVPRVTIDRISNASQIWHMGVTQFANGAGLWFAVQYLNATPEIKDNVAACLRVLQDTGLGGERGAGMGLFEIKHFTHSIPSHQNSQYFLTLSPLCPSNEAEVETLLHDGACYELLARRGWIGSPEGSNLRRKQLWMIAEGSLLCGNSQEVIGSLKDTKPDTASDLHPVYRYGFAFPVGVKL